MQDGFPKWLKVVSLTPTGTNEVDGRQMAGFDLKVRLRWYRFFFPSYWRSPRFRFR
jgi:hypothetical protein